MKPTQKPAPVKANAAKMVVHGSATEVAEPKLDLSYLENVVETIPDGTPNVLDAVEVTSHPTIPPEPTEQPNQPQTPAPAQDKPETVKAEEAASQTDDIEDARFKGKSKKDIYESYKNLESTYGKQANELGDYRKFFDQFMLKQAQQQVSSQPQPTNQPNGQTARPVGDEEDEGKLLEMMLSRPKDFVKQVRQQARNDVLNELQSVGSTQVIQQLDQQNADLWQDPDFPVWLKSNITPDMLAQADSNPKVRQFVFNAYRSMNGKPTQANPQAQPTATSNRTVNVSTAASGASTTVAKAPDKTWTRQEIRELYANNPKEYAKHAAEIKRAYDEGRVRNN